MSTIDELLEDTADLGIQDIRRQMAELDMNVTNKTALSLHSKVSKGEKVQIIAERSILTLVFGRKPGKMPPIEEIRNWAEAKGLPDGIEWPIAINISKFGTQIFQGTREGLDIDRTKTIMIDFFKAGIAKIAANQYKTIIIELYR